MLSPETQSARFIDPLSDFGFKKLFGSEPNKEILIDFLNQLFKGRKIIRDLIYNPTEKYGDDKESKKVYFDLLCTGDKGEQFLVEMQRFRQYFYKGRAVFYTSRLISEQLPKGEESWNYELKEVYMIALLEFSMEDSGAGYLHDYCLMDRQTGQIFYDKLEYKFIELPKFTKTEDQLETDLDRWLFLLKNLSRMDKIPVFLKKRVFQKVFKIAEIANLTKEERMFYPSKAQIEFEYNAAIEFAAKEAAEKAAKEAAKKAAKKAAEKAKKAAKQAAADAEAKTKKTVYNMIRKDYADTEICEILEVTPEYVVRTREEMEAAKENEVK